MTKKQKSKRARVKSDPFGEYDGPRVKISVTVQYEGQAPLVFEEELPEPLVSLNVDRPAPRRLVLGRRVLDADVGHGSETHHTLYWVTR